MKFGSLFAGIGGIDFGLERAGMTCAWQVENDEFCQKVLTKHWPHVPKYGDIRNVGKQNLESVDLIAGGFPCQDVSLAGKKRGLEGKKSTLWSEFYRVICEIRPEWVFIENVPGLFTSDDGRFFRKILWELSQIRYDAEWETIPAAAIGSPQTRFRLFIVAYPNSKHGNTRLVFHKEHRQTLFKKGNEYRSKLWTKTPAYIVGMAHGISPRLDRLKSLGNAVVPQVAEFIGRIIMEANNG